MCELEDGRQETEDGIFSQSRVYDLGKLRSSVFRLPPQLSIIQQHPIPLHLQISSFFENGLKRIFIK